MLNSVYIYIGLRHSWSGRVRVIDDWLRLLKRSVLLFDEVFISDEAPKRVATELTRHYSSWPQQELTRISRELRAVQAQEQFILRELPGAGEGKVIATANDVVKQVKLNRRRPTSEDEERSWSAISKMQKAKFPDDLIADSPLMAHITELNLGYSDLLDEMVSSNLNSPLHRAIPDNLEIEQNDNSLRLATLDELLLVRTPSFDHLPLDEVLDLRNEVGWVQLRGFVNELSGKIKEALLDDHSVEADIRGLIDRSLVNEVSNELLASKASARTVMLSYAKGIIGLIPFLDKLVTLYDLGIETGRFVRDRKHWLTFLSRIDGRVEDQS